MGLFGGKSAHNSKVTIKVSTISYKGGVMDYSDVFRRIKYREEPFNDNIKLDFNVYDFDGIQAIEILLNNELIGEVPGYMVDEILPKLEQKWELLEVVIYGGVDKRYGCSVTVRFL